LYTPIGSGPIEFNNACTRAAVLPSAGTHFASKGPHLWVGEIASGIKYGEVLEAVRLCADNKSCKKNAFLAGPEA
jgi:hypothetical protein